MRGLKTSACPGFGSGRAPCGTAVRLTDRATFELAAKRPTRRTASAAPRVRAGGRYVRYTRQLFATLVGPVAAALHDPFPGLPCKLRNTRWKVASWRLRAGLHLSK